VNIGAALSCSVHPNAGHWVVRYVGCAGALSLFGVHNCHEELLPVVNVADGSRILNVGSGSTSSLRPPIPSRRLPIRQAAGDVILLDAEAEAA
jgi:hypothetical protein